MTIKKETAWSKYMEKFRDVVFIILFISTSIGWIVSSTINTTKTKVVLEETIKSVNEMKEEMKEVRITLNKQSELNGQIIQYMKQQ